MNYITKSILLFLMVGEIFSQNYLVDVKNHPDSDLNTRDKNLVKQNIKSIKRNEFKCIDKNRLTELGSHTYLVDQNGNIYEEMFSDSNGNKKKYCYKYDNNGNVILKEEFKVIKNKDNKDEQITVKCTRFSYEYDYDRCIYAVTARDGKDSITERYTCGVQGFNRTLIKHSIEGDTVLKYDFYDNLIEEIKISPFTNQEIKKTTYSYIYNNNRPVNVKKITAELTFYNGKSSWKYTLEYIKKLLFDDNGNVKSILYTDSQNKPFMLYTYNYNFNNI